MALTRTIVPFPQVRFADYPRDPGLDSAVKRIGAKFPQLALGLIDLTPPPPGIPQSPGGFPYGGCNDDVNINIGSGAKVALMYAAYQLRQAVRDVLTGLNPLSGGTAPSLLSQLAQQLAPLVVSNHTRTFRRDTPNLRRILNLAPNGTLNAWNVSFTVKQTNVHDFDIGESKAENFGEIDKLGFLERLTLVIVESDNCASLTVAQDLGFQYINGVLAAAGFFDVRTNIGLWLGAGYGRGCPGKSGVGIWHEVPHGRFPPFSGFQVSSARMMAKLMGTIAEGRAVNSSVASGEMLKLMDKGSVPTTPSGLSGTRSYVQEGLLAAGRSPLFVASKLGIADFLSDEAIVERRSASGHLLKYVAVALRAPNPPTSTTGETMLHDVSVQLDNLIQSRHP